MSKTYLFNPHFLFIIIWFLALLLYSLGLSDIIRVDFLFIFLLVGFLFLYIFLLLVINKKMWMPINENYLVNKIKTKYSLYKRVTIFLFFIGSIGFGLELYMYFDSIPLFLNNKINAGTKNHYIHYITEFSMYSALLSSGIAIILGKKKFFIITILSSLELLIWLKRGEIFPIVFSIVFLFYIKMLLLRRISFFYFILMISVSLFVIFFSIVGNMRMEHVLQEIYGQTFNERYLLPEWMPLEFSWIYIYIATTLENARHVVLEQTIQDYTYGAQLFYPFLAPFLKDIIQPSYEAYLAETYGLTVSSFLPDAVNDFGIVGIFFYTFIFLFVSLIGNFFVNRGLFGIAICSLVHMIVIWSVFTNSLKNGVHILGLILFILLSLIYERYKRKDTTNFS